MLLTLSWGLELALLFGAFNHVERHAVLRASERVETFEFYVDFGPALVELVYTHERCVADSFENAIENCHKKVLRTVRRTI